MKIIELIEIEEDESMIEGISGIRNAIAAGVVGASVAAGAAMYQPKSPVEQPTNVQTTQDAQTPKRDRHFAPNYPIELASMEGSELKQSFMDLLLPAIDNVQSEILTERKNILRLVYKKNLSENDKKYLLSVMDKYGVDDGDIGELLKRVDVVPTSMALAQGALESGWGSSSIAQKTNGIFGQKGSNYCAFPASDGGTHPCFNNFQQSVESYMRNLNTHGAYEKFRQARYSMRKDNKPLDGYKLIGTLDRYSTLRDKYISKVRWLMKSNGFTTYDGKLQQAYLSMASKR